MKSLDEIKEDCKTLFATKWQRRSGYVIPNTSDIKLGNDAVEINAAVLYADLAGSTNLVTGYHDYFAAEVIKSFLYASCEVIKNNDGIITSFDGDRVMAIFFGDSKCTNAAKAGLQITAAVNEINIELHSAYQKTLYSLDYGVGIDVGDLFVIRAGIRGDNDLSWIGTPANIAAKLSEMRGRREKVFITKDVFERMNKSSRMSRNDGKCMWNDIGMNVFGEKIYGSSWYWSF